MRKFTRFQAPQIIRDNWKTIGENYSNKRNADPSYSFSWPQRESKKINHIALPILISQTDNHCSYCDKFPLHRGDKSIDHFKPKSNQQYYSIVCQWENLYLACKHCQDSKGIDFNELLLRPDDIEFSFARYFIYNYTTHIIDPNPSASGYDQERAAITIRIFDFNYFEVKTSRRHAFERYTKAAVPDINDFDYRFMFD